MSDEIERRLREAGQRLPAADPLDTLDARERFLATTPRGHSRRPVMLALAAAIVVGGAFGVGYAVAAGGKPVPKVIVKHVPARLDAGPGFLPAPGWATTVSLDPQTGAIGAAQGVNVTTGGGDATVRINARFYPASARAKAQQRLLPLQLPPGGRVRHLVAHVGAYAVEVTIAFGSAHPPSAALVAAREELGRLVVPVCPAAQALAPADAGRAVLYVLRWLPAHYSGDFADLIGARATRKLGTAMPRYGQAAADCGAFVARRSVEVDIVLPKLEKVSASLSQLTYFVAKTAAGWVVWERAR
jgi:hypothetical protein